MRFFLIFTTLFLLSFQAAAVSLPSGLAWLSTSFMGDEAWKWLTLILLISLWFPIKSCVVFSIGLFRGLLPENSMRHRTIFSIEKPIGLLVVTVLWFFAIHQLNFSGQLLNEVLLTGTKVFFCISLIWGGYNFSDVLTEMFERIAKKTDSDLDDYLVPFVSKVLKIFVVTIGALLTAQNLGLNVVSLMAGLGIGGLALAFAAKDTAANLFGSIMIVLDRPFRIGDWVITPSEEGTVEAVGFRSTRIRTFYNSLVSVPNSVLANVSIDNMGDRRYRRVKTNLGIQYNTPAHKVKEFCHGIRELIKAHPKTRKDYFMVYFDAYGSSSLSILVYFFLQVKDWGEELEYKEEVFLEILRLAEKLEVSFAFPSQSIYFENELNLKK